MLLGGLEVVAASALLANAWQRERRLLGGRRRDATDPASTGPRPTSPGDNGGRGAAPQAPITSPDRQRALAADREDQGALSELSLGGLCIGTGAAALAVPALAPLNLAVLGIAGTPMLRDTVTAFAERRITSGLINGLVTTGCVLTGQAFTASTIALYNAVGDESIRRAKGHARRIVLDAHGHGERTAIVRRDDGPAQVPVGAVGAGDIVLVAAGEPIPVDGCVVAGSASVDQQNLTGESRPAEVAVGDRVFASTRLATGRLEIRAERCGGTTLIAEVQRLAAAGAAYKSSLESRAEVWSRYSALGYVAGSAALVPMLGIMPALTVLWQAPVNGVRISASMATVAHLALASRAGALVKDGRALERLREIDTLLFDKTGTLTLDEPSLAQVLPLDGSNADTVLALAAAAQGHLSHPIAAALRSEAAARAIDLPTPDDADYQVGLGVTARIDGETVHVGSWRFMRELGLATPPEMQALLDRCETGGESLVLVAGAERVRGALLLAPRIRPEAKAVIELLHRQGIRQIAVVSGDHAGPTRALARSLGIDHAFHDVLPQDKQRIVARLQEGGRKVCFVGDGVNDAVALSAADVSISPAGAAAGARDAAQILLGGEGLAHLPALRALSEQLHSRGRTLTGFHYAVSIALTGGVLFAGLGLLPTIGLLAGEVLTATTYTYLPLLRQGLGRTGAPALPQPQGSDRRAASRPPTASAPHWHDAAGVPLAAAAHCSPA